MKRILLFLVLVSSFCGYSQNIFNGEPVQVVGSFNGYSTTPYNSDYRTTGYRKVSTTASNPSDGRGQWATTINVQSSGGDVTPTNMSGGSGNGFLFISGPSSNRFQNKWVFSNSGQGNLNEVVGISAYNSGNDMGLNMSAAGRYTFVFNDAGYTQTNAKYYVGYTTNNPVNVSNGGVAFSNGQPVISITTSANPSTGENVYVRYRVSTNDFTSSTSVVQATGSGVNWSATLPAQTCGSTIYYYVYTSTRTLSQINSDSESDRSLTVLRYDDNSGSNYSFTVSPVPTAGITNNSGTTVLSCAQQSINATATGGVSYLWDGGATPTTASNTFTTSGTYNVTVTGANGCSNTSSITITGVVTPPFNWYLDADADGFGSGEAVLACENPSTAEIAYVSNTDDCDDFNQNVYPGAPAICYNNIIEDCNGGTIYTGCPVLPVSITSPSCGSILNYRNAPISCNSVSVEGHTVQYRFRIVRSGDNFTASILRDVPNFTILQASYAAYVHPAAATYSVYVSLVVDGEQQPETEVACSISVPAVALPTQGLQNCDTVLTTPSTLVFGPSVSGAVEYQFEISLGGNVITTLTRPSNYFHSSTNFTEWNYGTTYTVKMKARKSNETFDQLAFGTACNLTYPAIPAQTQALVNCSNTLSTVSTLVFTPSVFGATSYRFELNDGSTTYTVTRPNAYFHFTTDFPEWNYGKTYSVKVQVARNNNVYGPLSTNACTLTSPAMPTPAQALVNCTTVMTSPTSLLFAPAVFGATDYQFVVTIPGTYYAQFEKSVPYFRLRDVEEWVAGTVYNVTVKAFRNGVESGESTSCTFTTPGTAPVAPVARIAQVPFAVKAYPNPYSNAFQLDVTSTDKTASIDVKVFDMLGRMVDSKNTTAGDLETATIGSDYPSGVYNVIVTQGEQTKVVRVVKR